MKRRFVSGLVALGVALGATLAPAVPAAASQTSYKVVFGFSGKCMEPREVNRNSFLQQWTCDGAAFQQWYFDYVGHDAQGTVHWRIRNAQSGKCASWDRDYVGQRTCGSMGTRELWTLTSVSGTLYYQLAAVHQQVCMTLQSAPAGKANGATIFVGGCGSSGTDPKQHYVDLLF